MALYDYLPSWAKAFSLSSPPTASMPVPGVAAREYGVSGTENYGGYLRGRDFNPTLDDWQKAVQVYDKMRRTDGQIRAILQVIKLPLRGATWTCKPASSDPIDKQIADFCTKSLFDDDALEDTWDHTLRHILLQLEFGFSVMEIVWKVDREGRYRFKRLAPRLPSTIREWHVERDGTLKAVVQYAPVPSVTTTTGVNRATYQSRFQTSMSFQYLTIPGDLCFVTSFEREGDNFEGTSILRPIYRNWHFKDEAYRIMAVGLDRWGVGIPVGSLKPGHNLTTSDKETLREILKAVRANERAYLVTPENVDFDIKPSGSGQGTLGNLGIQWIEHNDSQMSRSVLASFLTMGRDPVGTLGFGSRLTDMFISSLNGMAKGIASDIKKQLVKKLCDFNFDMTNRPYPTPVCMDLEQVDLSALIDVLAKLSGTMITPSDDDESMLRKILALPPINPTLRRDAKKPGAGGPPGAPPPANGGDLGPHAPPSRADHPPVAVVMPTPTTSDSKEGE